MLGSSRLPIWAQNELVDYIFRTATALNGEARIVGGAVRNWLAGKPVGDIDMVVNLPIRLVANELSKSPVLRIFDTGISHGTITVSNGGQMVELSQTRTDIATDGRHAVVKFQNDWSEDAARRDFTINAIYLDANGHLFDPLDGQVDLANKRLKFVGKAADRVQEDTLRMLRFCRFCIDFNEGSYDTEALTALSSFAPLARNLSGERVAQEMKKILRNENCLEVVKLLYDTGLDKAAIGTSMNYSALPTKLENMRLVLEDYGWLVSLVILTTPYSIKNVVDRLRLSRNNKKFCLKLVKLSTPKAFKDLTEDKWPHSAYFMDSNAAAVYACSAWLGNNSFCPDHYRILKQWKPPKMPLSGADFLSHGVDKGVKVGQMLDTATLMWVKSDFTLCKNALLEAVTKRRV